MNQDLTHRIRQRTYELWQAQPHGSELDNWLAAEREILQNRSQPAPAGRSSKKSRSRRKSH